MIRNDFNRYAPNTRAGRTSCVIGIVLISLIVLILLYAGGSLLKAFRGEPPLPPEAEMVQTPAVPVTPLPQQVQQVEQAVKSGTPQEISLQITPADLEEALVKQGKGRIDDGKVYFGDGVVVLQGKLQQGTRRLALTLRMEPEVIGGNLGLNIISAKVGSLNLPDAARSKIQQQIDNALEKAPLQDAGIKLTGVNVQPGLMILQGKTGQ